MSTFVITGTGTKQSLGHRIAQALYQDGHLVVGLTLSPQGDKQYVETNCDVTSWQSVGDAASYIAAASFGPVDGIINCAGVNKIAMLEDFSIKDWDLVMNTNARGIFYMAKAFLDDLKETRGVIVNIVSNASHMPMTSSLAYNASKGAAHIMTLQLARELTKRHGITVFGISPNKLGGTGMSDDIDEQVCKTRGWPMSHARSYQLGSMLAGKETNPDRIAELLAFLLAAPERYESLTGTILPYGA